MQIRREKAGKLYILVALTLGIFLFSFYSIQPRAEATVIRVDFSGSATSGPLVNTPFDGFFTYDDTGLPNTFEKFFNVPSGGELELSFTMGGLFFDETTASISRLSYLNTPNLQSWNLNGDFSGAVFTTQSTEPDVILRPVGPSVYHIGNGLSSGTGHLALAAWNAETHP